MTDYNAIIEDIPLIFLIFFTFLELSNEFMIHKYSKGIDNIDKNLDRIRELCTNMHGKAKEDEVCPVFNNIDLLKKNKNFRETTGYPFLNENSFRDVFSLAIKLRHSTDELSKYLGQNKEIAANKELAEFLEFYVDGMKDKAHLESVLRNMPLKFHEAFCTNSRRRLIHWIYGVWYHPIKTMKQEKYAYPAKYTRRFTYLFAIKLNKILYGPCIYDAARFSGITLSPDTETKLNDYLNNKNFYDSDPESEFKPLQLNRRLLEAAYPNEITREAYTNHLWNIIKFRFILTSKQAQYFELITAQIFVIALPTLKWGLSSDNVLIVIMGLFTLPAVFKEKPFDWFKNRYYRFIGALIIFLALYVYQSTHPLISLLSIGK